jgi:hypothetical protein
MGVGILWTTLLEAAMARLREVCVSVLSLTLGITPVWGGPSTALGTVVFADRAHVGAAPASVGTTVYGGDRLTTEQLGSVQVRAGAARLLLAASSSATIGEEAGAPAATLSGGTATFSTANAKAFALHAAIAEIRPQTDAPTIGQVTMLSAKQLIVRSTRGALAITVDGETQVIPEGMAYRVILDPSATPEPQGPRGAGTKMPGGPPLKAGRSRFLLIAITAVAVVTSFAVDEALESPDRP